MGKPGAGLMEASLSFLGVYSECIETIVPPAFAAPHTTGPLFSGKYCLASLNLPGETFWKLIKLKEPSPKAILETSLTPKLGLCLPSTCSSGEIQILANQALTDYIPHSSLTISSCSETNGKQEFLTDTPAILVVTFFTLVIIILLICSAVDYWFNYRFCSGGSDATNIHNNNNNNNHNNNNNNNNNNNGNSGYFSTISSTCSSMTSRSSGKSITLTKQSEGNNSCAIENTAYQTDYLKGINCHTFAFMAPFRAKTPTMHSKVSLDSFDSTGSQKRLRCRTTSSLCESETGEQKDHLKIILIKYMTALSLLENGRKILSVSGGQSSTSCACTSSSPGSGVSYSCHSPSHSGGRISRVGSQINQKSGSLASLHGLRVLMMIWIISGHSYSFAIQWLSFSNPNDLTRAPKNLLSQFFANGTFSVDTFLFISGLLVTHLSLKQMSKNYGKLNLWVFYLHRFVRMTPVMMGIIAFTATLMKYVTSGGPNFEQSKLMFDSWCQQNWYLNMLYIHNFVNRQNMCLPHTWYSAVDMQLYLIAPLLLIPLYHRGKVGVTLIVSLLAASSIITGSITISRHLPAVPYMSDDSGSTPDKLDEYYGSIYIKPYTRIGPYLVGMLLAYIIHTRDKLRISPTIRALGWSVAIISNLAVIFAMLPINQGSGYVLTDVLAGLYSATSRVIWSLTTAWLIICCFCGHGGYIATFLSSKYWLPWSRLTYCAYLIHPIVMAVFYGSRQIPYEFSHFLMIYIILGNIVITYTISFFLSLIFESPIVSIEKLLTSTIKGHLQYNPPRRRRISSPMHI